MTTGIFRRHTARCVDSAIHSAFLCIQHCPEQLRFFDQLLHAARQASEILRMPTLPSGEAPQISALLRLSAFYQSAERHACDWVGASGHPLQIVDSLAQHLFARYPMPRFLASSWLNDATDAQQWYIALAQGQSMRSLGLPLPLTRRMQHLFLQTPDHVPIMNALRRAEILGLGGSPELAQQLLATSLGEQFEQAEKWRRVLEWMVRHQAAIPAFEIAPLVDFFQANLDTVELGSRSAPTILRLMHGWHRWLGRKRMGRCTWSGSRWSSFVVEIPATATQNRPAQWRISELLDSDGLSAEGRSMRHCVASYASSCQSGLSSIWTLRHRFCDEEVTRSVLTIEVRPYTKTIVQVRGKANAFAKGEPADVVRRWAAREGLRIVDASLV
jgi:hypothetical protein